MQKGLPLVDLDLDLSPGRKTRALSAEPVRDLRESDLALLLTERAIAPTHIQRITSRHHALARCLASGMSGTEASLVTGYTPSRISVLRGDPAFEELISHYRALPGEAVMDLQARMTQVHALAVDILAERLEDAPETVPYDEVLDTAKVMADRTGHGPSSRTTNVNVNVNLGDRLRAARERANAVKTIEGVAVEVKP